MAARSFRITIVQGRTRDYQVTLYEYDGSTGVTLTATDVVRFKIGGRGATPLLDLDSVGATANGSVVTVTDLGPPAIATVRIGQGDAANLAPGVYDAEVLVVDDSETNPADAVKSVEQGVVHVYGSMGGDVGLT